MYNIPELYIQAEYIETSIGKCYLLKMSEYPTLVIYYDYFELDKERILKNAKKDNYEGYSMLEEMSLIEIIKANPQSYQNYNSFLNLFFKDNEDTLSLIKSDKELESVLGLIKETHCIKIEKPNPNPEIEKYNQLRRKMMEARGEKITHESMYTSVWVGTNQDPKDLTIYQFHKLFDRIAKFKSYDTTTLFATVATDVDIKGWYSASDDDENVAKQQKISEEQFNKIKNKKEVKMKDLDKK